MSTARAVATNAAVRTHAPGASRTPIPADPAGKRHPPGIGRPAASTPPTAAGTANAAATASATTTGSGSPTTTAAGDLIAGTRVETWRPFGAIAAATSVPSDRAIPSGASQPCALSVQSLCQRTRSSPSTRAADRICHGKCAGTRGPARATRAPGR